MRRTLAALCAGILLAACSEGADVQPIGPDPDASGPDVADEAPDEPEPPTGRDDDPFAIPEEIDDAYVQAVLDELFALRTEALRLTVEANGQPEIPSEALRLIDASHDGEARAAFGEDLRRALRAENVNEVFVDGEQFDETMFHVEMTVAGDSGCLIAIGRSDRSGTLRGFELEGEPYAVASLTTADQADERNPTPWKLLHIPSILQDGERAELDDILAEDPSTWVDFADQTCEEPT